MLFNLEEGLLGFEDLEDLLGFDDYFGELDDIGGRADSDLSGDSESEEEDMRGRVPRRRRKVRNPYRSPFYREYIVNGDEHEENDAGSVWDQNSYLAKGFRWRFGVTYNHFHQIYLDWNQRGEYRNATTRNGERIIDARILMMGSLAILTQDMTFDWMEMVSETSTALNHKFFRKFIFWFRNEYEAEWIRFPNSDDEMAKVSFQNRMCSHHV